MTSASAQTMNQIYEIARDGKMKRTMNRPLPSGQVSVAEASGFAAASGMVGLGVLGAGATPATAAVAATTMVSYAALYTPLKVVSPYNTHIGAISGTLPTLMGFTAALGGAGLCASPWLPHAVWLFTMQALWQMPHFYALAWLHRADYVAGGYKMFPLSDKTGHATAAMSRPYLVVLCAMPWVASAGGLASWMLPVGCLVPSAFWWRTLNRFEAKPNSATCRRFFLASLSYLLAMLALFTAYTRVERPAAQHVPAYTEADAEAEQQLVAGGQATVSKQDPVGPMWRREVSKRLDSFCPHDMVWPWFVGYCPFPRRDAPTS